MNLLLLDVIPAAISILKVTASMVAVVVLVTEMFFVADYGLGRAVFQCYQDFQIARMYAYVFVTGVVGVLVNKAIDAIVRSIRNSFHGVDV